MDVKVVNGDLRVTVLKGPGFEAAVRGATHDADWTFTSAMNGAPADDDSCQVAIRWDGSNAKRDDNVRQPSGGAIWSIVGERTKDEKAVLERQTQQFNSVEIVLVYTDVINGHEIIDGHITDMPAVLVLWKGTRNAQPVNGYSRSTQV